MASSIPLFSALCMLEVHGHKSESQRRRAERFVEERVTKAACRSSVLFLVL